MIKMVTPIQEIDKKIEIQIKRAEKAILKKLSYIGESALIEARSSGDYMDQTGNLRSSVGYVILNNGNVVSMSSFDSVRATATNGKSKGLEAINSLRPEYSNGYVLLVVAGMDYAVYVEALGRNVLSSSKLMAEIMSRTLL